MSRINYPAQKTPWVRKLKPKLPKYLIQRKASALREKIIARKYASIFLEKVFGKYHPTACTQYYKNRLLRKSLEKLKLNWFENKEVHRLTLNATIHYEGKIAGHAFKNWQHFTEQSKELKRKLEIAGGKYDDRILSRSFEKWKIVAFYKKKLRTMRCAATKLYNLMYTFLLLLGQMKSLCHQKRCILLDSEAMLFLRGNLLRKYVNKWKSCLSEKKRDEILQCKANEHYRNSSKSLYFKNWYKYICYKRTKNEILKLSTELYEDNLLKKSFHVWKYRFEETITEKKNMTMVDRFYRVSIKRRMIKCWKCYAKHKLYNRNLKHKADFFYRMRMKQKTLNSLSKNVIRRTQAKMACQKLSLFYKRVIVSNVWNKWTLLIDERHDWELSDKLLTARVFHKRKSVRKYFTMWTRYKTSQNRKKALNLRARHFCEDLYFTKYLATWKVVYSGKKRQTMLNEKATKFHDDTLIQICTSKWIAAYNRTISLNEKYEVSVSHYKAKIMRRYFVAWVSFCNSNIQTENLIQEATKYYLDKLRIKCLKNLTMNVNEMKLSREKLQTANTFFENKLFRRIFSGWKEYYRHITEYSAKIDEFQKNISDRSLKTVVFHWKLYLFHKKCNNRKMLLSGTHHRRKLVNKMFKKLKNYVDYRKRKNGRKNLLKAQVEMIDSRMIEIYLCKWRNAHGNILRDKCKVFQAHEFYKTCLKRKYFSLCLTFCQKHKIKMQLKTNLIKTAECFMFKKYMSVWYTKYQAVQRNHFKERWATGIWEMKLKYKCFKLWKSYVENTVKQELELENAKEFHKKLVVKEGLRHIVQTCLHRMELRYEKHLKSVTRKSSQDFEILRIYFNKWLRAASFKNTNKYSDTNRKSYNCFSNERFIYLNPESARPQLVIPECMRDHIVFLSSDKPYSKQMNLDINEVENKNVTSTTQQSSSIKKDSRAPIFQSNKGENSSKSEDLKSVDFSANTRILKNRNSVQNVRSQNSAARDCSSNRKLSQGQENVSRNRALNSRIANLSAQSSRVPVILGFDEWKVHHSRQFDQTNAVITEKSHDFPNNNEIQPNQHSNGSSEFPQLEKDVETNALPIRMSNSEMRKENLYSPDSLNTSSNASKTYSVHSPFFLQQLVKSNPSNCLSSHNSHSTCRQPSATRKNV